MELDATILIARNGVGGEVYPCFCGGSCQVGIDCHHFGNVVGESTRYCDQTRATRNGVA